MSEIRITLETLYDILRNEKKREELQQLEETFFEDVVSYLKEKKALLESKQESDEIFASGERDKLEYELKSIKRILKEIYEKREKKIIDIALNKSKTGSDLIDTSSMLKEEKAFYGQTLATLDAYRRGILGYLFRAEMPNIFEESTKDPSTPQQEPVCEGPRESAQREEELSQEDSEHDEPILESEDEAVPESTKLTPDSKQPAQVVSAQDMMKVKFIHPMPSFVWKDMKVYGPYDVGEEIEIFPEVAELLVRKGRAQKV